MLIARVSADGKEIAVKQFQSVKISCAAVAFRQNRYDMPHVFARDKWGNMGVPKHYATPKSNMMGSVLFSLFILPSPARCSCSRAPASYPQHPKKKATHISVSRLSFGVIRRLRMVLHPARCRRTCAVGWFAPFRDGEHAQVVVGVGGGKEDFIDLCRTGAVAIPSGYDVAFLIWAGGDGGVTFGDFKAFFACCTARSHLLTSSTSSMISASFITVPCDAC